VALGLALVPALGSGLALVVPAVGPAPGPASAAAPAATPAATPAVGTSDARPAGRPALDWQGCGGGFECATLAVPRDHAAPAGPTLDLALVRAPARGERIGSLVLNPGGPGASAVDFVRAVTPTLPGALRDRFDVVGFDPRGTGSSAPVDCRYDMGRYYALDTSPDSDAERAALLAGVREFVAACAAANGDLLDHVRTEDTVRDLDRVRAALGDDRLTYLGFSYGTSIGAAYAAAYPDRVRALVLDGAVDPTRSGRDLQVEQAAGFERVLDEFLAWCAGDDDCAFRRDGAPGAALDRLRARVDAEGLAVPGGRRRLSPTEVDLGLAAALYRGRPGFPALAEALAAGDRGDGGPLARLADAYAQRYPDGSHGNIQEAFLAISCADGPPVGTVADLAAVEAAAAVVAPRVGRSLVNNSLACAFWPVAPRAAPPPAAPDAPPVVVIGTRRDPATPFAWSEALVEQLGGRAVLISAPGSQHTGFLQGSRCVDDAVVRYLVTRKAPPDTLVCPRR
jgi:pimeloyl-ACP methyl ester carboxylesterase